MEFTDNHVLSFSDGEDVASIGIKYDKLFEEFLVKLQNGVTKIDLDSKLEVRGIGSAFSEINTKFISYLGNRYTLLGQISPSQTALNAVQSKIKELFYDITKDKYMFSFKLLSLVDMTNESLRKAKFNTKPYFVNEKKSAVGYRLSEPEARGIVNDTIHFIHRVAALYDHTVSAVQPSLVNIMFMIYARMLYYELLPVFIPYVTKTQGAFADKDGKKMGKYLHRIDATDINDFFVDFNLIYDDDDNDRDESGQYKNDLDISDEDAEEEAAEFLSRTDLDEHPDEE